MSGELVLSREEAPGWKSGKASRALKDPSDMKMQTCKESYFWRQKHVEQRHGDGKGVLLCAE